MNLEPEFEALLQKWVSEEAIYEFLRAKFRSLNIKCFEGRLSQPKFQIKPMWLSTGLMGERNSGADYTPAEGNRPAEIGMFTVVLTDEEELRRVLAHEMIHYWEHITLEESDIENYPPEIDKDIDETFGDSGRERKWRTRHSRRFISKACGIAQSLGISRRSILFG